MCNLVDLFLESIVKLVLQLYNGKLRLSETCAVRTYEESPRNRFPDGWTGVIFCSVPVANHGSLHRKTALTILIKLALVLT